MNGLRCFESPDYALEMAEAWRDAIEADDLDEQERCGPIVDAFVIRVYDFDHDQLDERHREALKIAKALWAELEARHLEFIKSAPLDDDIPF